jgi:hypothetical protein
MAHEIQFARGTFFKTAGGMTHLKHTLRDRFDKSRITEPNIRISVFQNGEMQEAKKEDLYGAYNYNLEHKQRKNANLFFEYMVSDYEPSKTQEIAEYLHQKLEGRPVYAIEHMDEAHYHTHFVIFEKDEQHPRSMNLKKADLRALRWDIGKITQQIVKSAGSGLQEHVGPRGNLEFEKKLVMQQREKAQSVQVIQQEIQQILDIYGAIEIYSLNYSKGKFQIYNHGLKQFSRCEDIPWAKIQDLQERGEENILFAPAKNDQIRAVFIDDIPVDKIAELPKGAVVVQTSSQKFQAHIPLSEPVSSEKAAEIQKTLAVMYGGDIASTDVYHLRRMPGFRNWKYPEPVYAGIAYVQTEGQTLDVVLANAKQVQKQFSNWQKQLTRYLSANTPKVQEEAQEIVRTMAGKWDTLYEQKQDPSSADFSWCLACFQRGYDPQAIAVALLEVSRDLATRKQGHIEDYVNRTVSKAHQLAKQLFREEIQPENQKIRTQEL